MRKRMFYSIRKTNFQTVDTISILKPLSYITVDDVLFRLMSIKRSYDAEKNSLTQQFEAKWLGGKAPTPTP